MHSIHYISNISRLYFKLLMLFPLFHFISNILIRFPLCLMVIVGQIKCPLLVAQNWHFSSKFPLPLGLCVLRGLSRGLPSGAPQSRCGGVAGDASWEDGSGGSWGMCTCAGCRVARVAMIIVLQWGRNMVQDLSSWIVIADFVDDMARVTIDQKEWTCSSKYRINLRPKWRWGETGW